MIRKLPLGIQDFPKLREGAHVYVDKTAIIHSLISGPMGAYFLSRPRRFGKSLLCSTLEAIYQGRRNLFQKVAGYPALAIDSMDWEWKKYPVIMLLLNSGEYIRGVKDLRISLHNMLSSVANDEEIKLQGRNIKAQFSFLIKELYSKYNEKVVIIIDEYDKPLLDTIDKPKHHINIRASLKSFYGTLKATDKYLKMVFITGVTKFSQVSIFSDLNHLTDLTFNSNYADICGLTQEEIEKNFEPEIKSTLAETGQSREEYLEELQLFYNGYRFTKKPVKVFNPFGLIQHFFNNGEFLSYWYDTGSPTFLIKLIKDQKIDILDLKNKRVGDNEFKKFDIENLDALPILYQSGYLTISDYDKESKEFILDYPNLEVRSAFSTSLLELLNPTSSDIRAVSLVNGMLLKGEIHDALTTIKQFLASIPYDLVRNTENYYHTAIHLIFTMLGLNCRSEVRISSGRIDTVVKTKKYLYIFEFKLDKPAIEALAQIDTKEYMLPYVGKGKKIFKIGVSFCSEKRNIDSWKIEN